LANENVLKRAGTKGITALKELENLALKNKLTKSITNKSEHIIKQIARSDDPLRELGPGISSYHQLLMMLFALFFILTLIHIPVMNRFNNGTFYDEKDGLFARLSLGNMGFSQTRCETYSMHKGNAPLLACKSGLMTEIVDWGIIQGTENKLACVASTEHICGPILNKKLGTDRFNHLCKGKQNCTLSNLDELLQVSHKTADVELFNKCYRPSSRIFFQFMCK
jgi:hypothetical protein